MVWFSSYLTDRTQIVKLGTTSSSVNNITIRDFQKWLPSNKWRHCWGTEQTGTNEVTEYQAENHL